MIDNKIRFFDLMISSTLLIFFSPLMMLIFVLVLILDGRPVIFKQLRIGMNGKKFNIYKFRSMNKLVFKKESSRLTTFGRILRRTSLDELPQLFNVLNKDMSLVGPRPLPFKIEKKIKKSIKIKRRKILPGLTGMSQVNFTGKNRKLDKKVDLDLYYIDNYNLRQYFKILIKTPAVLLRRIYKNKSSIIK